MGEVVRFRGVSLLVQDALFEVSHDAAPICADGRKRDTKSIGDRSEAVVLAALVKAGYYVSIPFGENQRYDLLVDDGTRILRVQVKTGRLRGDVIKYSCQSSHWHRGGAPRPYFGQADIIAVFCPENGKVYLLPEKEFVATRAHLRLSEPANNQRRRIRWASEFELA
jgi:PD-(D/E)XK nuclease superfamily protein